MSKIAILIAIVMLGGMLAFTSYASYSGLGLITSTTNSTNPERTTSNSGLRSAFFPVFIGGGPGSGK